MQAAPKIGIHVSRPLLYFLFLLIHSSGASLPAASPDPSSPVPRLEQGAVLEQEISGGESHTYEVFIETACFITVVVEHKGIDLVVAAFGPTGEKLSEVDRRAEIFGAEPISVICPQPGVYRFMVSSRDPEAPAGHYSITIRELRSVAPEDYRWVEAEQWFARAESDRIQGTGESMRKALEVYEKVLLVWKDLRNDAGQAETLNNMGYCWALLGENGKALQFFHEALPLMQSAKNMIGEGQVLNNIGMIYDSLGEKHKALEYHLLALPIRHKIGDLQGEAGSLNNIGLVYTILGEMQKALDYHHQAIRIWRSVGDRSNEAKGLHNLGRVYLALGDQVKALQYFLEGLDVAQASGDRLAEASLLYHLGAVHDLRSEKEKALSYFQQSIQIWQELENPRNLAYAINRLGALHDSIGEKEKAIDCYAKALELHRTTGDRKGEADVLVNLGKHHSATGAKEQALEFLSNAVKLYKEIGYLRAEAEALFQTARVKAELGNKREALPPIEASLRIIESLRTSVMNPDLRASYLASEREHYEFYVDLLMRLHQEEPLEGHDALALHAAERARARSLLELLSESQIEIREGVDPALLEQERKLQQLSTAKREKLMRLLSRKHKEEEAAAATDEIEDLQMEYEQVQARIRLTSPRYASLTQPQPLTMSEIQTQVLDPNTLLLEYHLAEPRSFLWVVSTESIHSFRLPGRIQIEAACRKLYDLLDDRSWKDSWETSLALSEMVLGPAAVDLGSKRLLIVTEGALQYIPFAVLPAPGKEKVPLVVDHEIVGLPSASVLAVLRKDLASRKPPDKILAVLADPVFDAQDERIPRKRETAEFRMETTPDSSTNKVEATLREELLGFSRLPFSQREAREILKLVPAGERMEAFGLAATRAQALAPELSQYRFVHFATHGYLNATHPEFSGLVLSLFDREGQEQEGFLTTGDVFNLKLNADLVVLSACRTALGKEVKGEGLIGLVRGFLYAGAGAVVASLWRVDDVATAELMKRFYHKMLEEGFSPASALRAAQLEMRNHKRWHAPYYWAGFLLQGEWK